MYDGSCVDCFGVVFFRSFSLAGFAWSGSGGGDGGGSVEGGGWESAEEVEVMDDDEEEEEGGGKRGEGRGRRWGRERSGRGIEREREPGEIEEGC